MIWQPEFTDKTLSRKPGAVHIDQGSAPSVSVTGARNDKDKERILSLLEEIWQDDSWLPAA